MTSSNQAERYSRVAITLHWLIGLCLLGQIAFGFLLDAIAPRGTPDRANVINLHKSIGITLALLILARLAWRLRHKPPRWPASMTATQQRAALLGHRALYLFMVTTPLAGYVASNFSKFGVKYFGLSLPPWGPNSQSVYAFFNGMHVASAWILCALIAGHIAIAVKHALIDRDGVFLRMWPRAS